MKSCLYTGQVAHRRTWVANHGFFYPLYFYVFDLDELGEVAARIPFFGYNRRRLVALHDRDYLTPGREPLRQKLDAVLHAHGCADGVTQVKLLTCARVFNYIFNPVSFFYCLRADGSLRCVVANVNNTFGDSHLYVLQDALPSKPGFAAHYQAVKSFHVSPFFDLEGRYDFYFNPPGDGVEVQVELHKEGQLAFVVRLRGQGRELTTGTLLRTLLRYPFTAFLTMPRIFWQAARLGFQRHLPVHSRPNPFSPMTIRVAPPTLSRRLAMRSVTRIFEHFRHGELELRLPDQRVGRFGTPGTEPHVRVTIRNWDFFWRLATGSDIGLGESYMAGDWECEDPAAFLELLLKNWERIESERGGWFTRTVNYLRHCYRANTPTGSRQNIREHYDLSNAFFQLFLDPTMLYSCAWFADDAKAATPSDDPLSVAQIAKVQRLLDKAQIGPDDHVLEIGCGWGTFAIEAVRRTGCRVTAITVSEEQLKLARERVSAAGLAERIHIELCDYRHVQGSFSRIVSIEMLEAVGHRYLGTYFAALDRLLTPHGYAVIQTITIPDARYNAYRRTSDFIRKHIFPGGHLPCLAELRKAAARSSSLQICSPESIGLHYVPTLRHWRERLLANANSARALGFDDIFLRKWEFYFVYCQIAFAERLIDNVQFVVCRNGESVPRSVERHEG